MRFLPLLLLALPLTASAAPLNWGLDGAASVEIAGPVEVPLYRGATTQWLPTVELGAPGAKAEDPSLRWMAIVDLGGGWSQVDPSTVAALGLKAKKTKINGADAELVILPEVNIGGMKLVSVRAIVKPGTARIGVGTLPEIAAAILPSTGKVKFVPAASADALLAEVGSPVALTRVPAVKYFEYGQALSGTGTGSYLEATVFGQKGLFYLRTYATTKVDEGVTIPPGHSVAGVAVAEDTPLVGGVPLDAVVVQHYGAIADPKGEIVGILGYDALYGSDLAYAPATDKLAIRRVGEAKFSPAEPRVVELAREDFDVAEKKAAEKPTPPPPATDGGDPGDPGATGRHTKLASAYEKARQWPAAIAEYETAAKTAGDHCEPYLALGAAYLSAGQPESAISPLTKAGTLFDKWYSQELESREFIKDGKKVPGLFSISQGGNCNSAWSKLATAQLALGKHDEVAKIYAGHNGMDPDVPFAYGLSLLASGRPDAADGPLREAMNMGGRADVDVRSALSVASAQVGASAVANAQLDVIAAGLTPSLSALLPHIEGLRAAGGDAAALQGAQAAVAGSPWSSAAQLLLVRELKRAASADLAAAQARLDALVTRESAYTPSPAALARKAAAQAVAGNVDAARAYFTGATADGPDFWAAKAVAFEGTPDAKEAVDSASRAALSPLMSVKIGG